RADCSGRAGPRAALARARAAGRGEQGGADGVRGRHGRERGPGDLAGRRTARRRRDLHGDTRALRRREPGPRLSGAGSAAAGAAAAGARAAGALMMLLLRARWLSLALRAAVL